MNLSTTVLTRYIALPDSERELRNLLDDIGIEVKKMDGENIGVELLANRGDHYCYAGIAREIHGRTASPLHGVETAAMTVGDGPNVVLQTPLCLRYSATLLERVAQETPFSESILAPLAAAGIHSLGAAIDATNLSNIEIGQPTHTFDADTIVGPICIRLSRQGETAWPLFAEITCSLVFAWVSGL